MSHNTDKTSTYLSFYLGNELFGANVGMILEVLKGEQVTDIPRSEDFIKGIINFRGEIVPVIDFQKKLNLSGENSHNQRIIIVVELFENEQKIKIGLLVDNVRKVFDVSEKEIKSVPDFGQYFNPEFLTGITKTPDGLVSLLDLEKTIKEKDIQLLIESKNKHK